MDINSFNETNPFLRGLVSYVEFNQPLILTKQNEQVENLNIMNSLEV